MPVECVFTPDTNSETLFVLQKKPDNSHNIQLLQLLPSLLQHGI